MLPFLLQRVMTNATQDSMSEPEYPLYNVTLVNKGSLYSKTLYDVDGFVLLSESGEKLNVYTKTMQDAFDSGRLRVIRSLKDGGYVYFITQAYQLQRFKDERDNGSIRPHVKYYIYRDLN